MDLAVARKVGAMSAGMAAVHRAITIHTTTTTTVTVLAGDQQAGPGP